MAQYVVLTTYDDAGQLSVSGAAFTAVPGGNNSAGVAWTDVIRDYRVWRNRRYSGVTTEAVVPVTPAIQAGLDNGTLFEWRWTVLIPTGLTNPEAVAAIEAGINVQEADVVDRVADELRYWGFTGAS